MNMNIKININTSDRKLYGKILFAAVLIAYFCQRTVNARPSDAANIYAEIDPEKPVDPSLYNGNLSHHTIRQIQKCDKDVETMELCMRCAKVTRSEIVYPMCCDDEEDVKGWCQRYIYFGASPSELNL